MGNPLRGQASFKAGAESYTLTFDVNIFVEIEEATGYGMGELVQRIQSNPSFGLVRAVVCGGLQAKHEGVTARRAGEIISDAGLDPVTDALKRALAQALPAPKAESGSGNPRKARGAAGTG